MARRILMALAGLILAVFLVGCGGRAPGAGAPDDPSEPMESGPQESEEPQPMQGYEAGIIPTELEYIPDAYFTPAEHAGTLEKLEYETYDSFNFGIPGNEITKTAWIYVPYGYDPEQRYDVFYLSHGGWSNETTQMGTPDNPSYLKLAVDHAIEDGLIEPLIMVMPTYNNLSPEDSGNYSLALQLTDNFHNELVESLMPAVESRYSTYADDVTPEGLEAARDHRAFGGFSMGSVNTWHTFEYCLPYFSMFMPMSGGAGWSGEMMERIVRMQGFDADDFFIFGMSGTDDFAYSGFRSQVLRLPAEASETFVLTDSLDGGNVAFREREGYAHDGYACTEYTYNGMRLFFNGTRHADDGATSDDDTASDQAVFTQASSIDEVVSDPAFGDWGRLIFPADQGYMRGSTLGNLSLTWYQPLDSAMTVDIVNDLHARAAAGETVFIDLYSEAEKAEDPAKADTGLFFFPGEPGARTAVVSAGGGFAYVGALHDSFPHCMELARRGYNAFAIIYRPGAQTACEDLARAIALLHEHADELGISMEGYSLWGGSAGARMSAWLGAYGTAAFGEDGYPRAGACIVNYTGFSEVTGAEPPTYSAVGTADGIASWRTMQTRIERIRANGTPAQIEVFDGLGHGFGLGTGTVAEGWIDHAIAFWEDNV